MLMCSKRVGFYSARADRGRRSGWEQANEFRILMIEFGGSLLYTA